MSLRPFTIFISLAGAALMGSTAQAGIPQAAADAMQLAAPCAACHQAEGRNSFIPVLRGMNADYLLRRMADFRRQTQGDQIMHSVANALTAQETALIARYFAGQPAPAP